MFSFDLRAIELKEWHDFGINSEDKLLQILPEKNGIYVIRACREFGRYSNASDIVYIGCAPIKTLKTRIKKYFRPGKRQATNLRINAWLKTDDHFQISWKEINNQQTIEQTQKLIKDQEKDLLRWYEQDHGELPPFNRQS